MKTFIALLALSLPVFALADNPHPDCVGNPHACGDDVILIPGPVGPQGPAGPQGEPGLDGRDGVDGQDGKDGIDGEDGEDGEDGAPGQDGRNGRNGRDITAQTAVGVEGVIRLYDGKRITIEAFDAYDVRGRRNHFAGARVTLKVGRSYEERMIAQQNAQLMALSSVLNAMEADLRKLKRYAHHPYTGQHRVYDLSVHSDSEPPETLHKTNGGKKQ